MIEMCGNCQWFEKEDVYLESDSVAFQLQKLNDIKNPAISGGSQPSSYGKCRANFIDKNGDYQEFDMGMFTNFSCRASDDSDPPKHLFIPLETP